VRDDDRVKLLSGWKVIEEVQKGDLILSRSEFDPDGQAEAKVVEEVFGNAVPVLQLHVEGWVIRAAARHSFYVQGKGWLPVRDVQPGDRLCSHNGRWVAVEEVVDAGEMVVVCHLRVADFHTYFVGGDEWGFGLWVHNTGNQFNRILPGIDPTAGQQAVDRARAGGTFDEFRQELGPHAAGHFAVALRRAYAAALLDEAVPGVTPQQGQAILDALVADPELKLSFPQDGCHARAVLMVEAMKQMGVSPGDIGKVYAFHRNRSPGGGWVVTTRDGQTLSWREHVDPTVVHRNGGSMVLDPALADAPLDVNAWLKRLGAPDFQHTSQTIRYAQTMLGRLNRGNVAQMLSGVQKLNADAYHYLISNPATRDQLQRLGAALPPEPNLGWRVLQGEQPQDSHRFLRDLGRQNQTGAIIQVSFGIGPFPDTSFDTASDMGEGVTEARRFLGSLP
jgi:hypothetical protein